MSIVPFTNSGSMPGMDPDLPPHSRHTADAMASTNHPKVGNRSIVVAIHAARSDAVQELSGIAELGGYMGFVNVTESVNVFPADGHLTAVVSMTGDGVMPFEGGQQFA
jgi:hypothetical protein